MNERARLNALIVGAVVLGLLSVGGGALIALFGDDGDRAEPGRSVGSTPTPSDEPSESTEPSEGPQPSPAASPIIEDGHHFVYVEDGARLEDGSTTVTFDLAYFYRGDRAAQEAAERGDEVVNDYYIVNDNPKLRTLPLAADVKVAYIPADLCCELQPGNVDAWLEAVLETNPTDYAGTDVPWWFTVRGGEIVRIEQPYLP